MVFAIVMFFTFLLMFLKIPIYVAFLLPAFITVAFLKDTSILTIVQTMFGSLNKFSLMAVPYFIFAAEIMSRGGMAKRLVDWATSIVGRTKGGLAITTVLSANMFGAMSGSSPATVAAMGSILYPRLTQNYDQKFSAGLITSVGAIALIIPPSISMILYGIIAEESIGKLFIAGILPGILLGLCYVLYIIFYVNRTKNDDLPQIEVPSFLKTTKESIWALGVPIIVIGGIYSGFFTPTESAAIAAVYAIIISLLVYKEVGIKDIFEIAISSGKLTAKIFILISASSFLSYLLIIDQIPANLTAWIELQNLSAPVILLLINLILLIVGMVIDPNSAILIFTPLFYPIVTMLGVDPIHFGIIMTVNLAIGMFTPPFGLNIFVASANMNLSISKITPGLLPFIIISIIALLIITYIPSISLLIPNYMN